jgi:flagellar biosynthetic protein FlhB
MDPRCHICSECVAASCCPWSLCPSLVLAGIGGNMIQHRLVWSAEGLKPGLSKISPLVGLMRLFSSQSLANFGKGVAKLIIIGAALTMLMWPERTRMEALVTLDPAALLAFTGTLAMKIMAQ